MDTMGQFVGGGKRYLPAHEIQKMKANMRKVPLIQKKSDQYHQKESQEAEHYINEQLITNNEQGTTISNQQKNNHNKNSDTWLKKIKEWVKDKIKKFYSSLLS